MDNIKSDSWNSRNRAIKTFSTSGNYGWLKLVIGEKRTDKRKFLRLKKYLNWFSIPDEKYLLIVKRMLIKGARELGWDYEESKEESLKKEQREHANLRSNKHLEDIPIEMVNLLKNFPNFTEKLIALNLKGKDPQYVFDLIKVIDDAISKSSERLKLAFKEIISKISKEDSKGMQELSDLMGKMNLLQITSLTNIIKSRLELIDTFEQLIFDEKTFEINTEKSVHRILEKSMWLLDEDYWIVQSNKTLRTFIGDEILKTDRKHAKKRPDFACTNLGNKLIIVEIKRPSLELRRGEIDQAELYHLISKKYRGQKYNSIEVYLVGNKISDEARELIELRRGIFIKTYSEILESCRSRYREYLKIVES